MNIAVFDKTYTVEFPISTTGGGGVVFFPIIQVLDQKLLTSIETFIPEISPLTPSGKPAANSALLAVSFVTLVVGDTQEIWNMPLLKLLNLNNQFFTGVGSSNMQVELNFLKVIWSKSFITIADPGLINSVIEESFYFNLGYSDYKPSLEA